MSKFLIFLTCLLIASNTQANDSYDIFTLSLADLATIEIAAKRKQTIYSSPSTVSTVSRSQLQQLGINDLQTLLNFIPGFQSSRDVEQGTANRITARGRSTALSESVLVQIDGNRINDLYTGGISIINRLLNIGNIERIEIIRGPGSALYGGNAFLGVINIITTSNISQLNLSVSDTGRRSSQLLYHSTDNTFDLFASAFDDQGDNYSFTDLYGTNTPTKDPNNGHDLYLKYQYNQWQFIGRHMQRQLNDFLPLGSIGNNINKEKTMQWALTTAYQQQINDDATLNLKAHYSQNEWNTRALLIPKAVEIAPGFALNNNFIGGPYLRSNGLTLNGELAFQYTDQHFITLGASWEQARISDVYTSTTHNLATLAPYSSPIKLTGGDSFNVLETRHIQSIFAQDQMLVNTQWEITAGVRFDNYSDFGSTLNPRIAVVWKPNTTSSIKMLYGSAFRAPNFLELYDKNNYVDFGNTNLSAEQVKTYELGWINTYRNWHWEVTFFHNSFDQLIELGDPVENEENPFFAPQFTNRDNQEVQGLESELRIQLLDELTLQANYTWFDSHSDISTERQNATIIVNYQHNNINANFHSYYRGRSALIAQQSSYWISAVNITYQYSPELTLSAKISNIFDKDFRTPSIVYPNGVPNRGRVASLTLAYNY